MRRTLLIVAACATALGTAARAEDQLNALVWCDHTDDAFIKPFEEAHHVKVNLKEYEGTGAAFSILDQSRPGDWDVFVVDSIDVPRAIDRGLLAPLPKGTAPTADMFPEIVMPAQTMRDGKTYAVTDKFGYNTISYDSSKVKASDLADMTKLWSGKFKGRIAVYDYYLPVEGLVAVGLGMDTQKLTKDDLPKIKDALFKLKDSARSVGEVTASQTALATGEVDILVGGGEWVTAGLHKEKPNLDWMIPDQGAVRWSEAIGVFAASKHKDLADAFVKYVMSPEAQAKLATSSCYWAMPANRKAGDVLTAEQKAALRWDDQAGYLKRAQLYPSPDASLDKAMQDVWTEMLQH